MTRSSLKSRWTEFAASPRGRLILKAARAVFVLGILAYLVFELRDIGWAAVRGALPTHPLFYLFFILLYFLLPVAEILNYRITWTFDVWKSVPAFLKKRIYNNDVLEYSGEVYFYTWARRHLGLTDRAIFKTIRDQNIVSSVASTMVALLLVAIFLLTGQINVLAWVGQQKMVYVIGGVAVGALLLALGIRLRKYLFSMAFKTASLIFAVHFVRLLIGQTLQIGMWALAMPEVPLRIWFTYAAVSIIVTRIPFAPSRDLIFLGLGVSLSSVLQISEAGVFGMLGVITVLRKMLNLIFFGVLTLLSRRTSEAAPSGENQEPTRETEALPEPESASEVARLKSGGSGYALPLLSNHRRTIDESSV